MNGNMISRLYWLHCLSPLHVGAGQGADYIDKPIMREKVTHWPFVPGSSVKGVLADCYHASDAGSRDGDKARAFGKAAHSDDDQAAAAALSFSDASLVCLPVRSLYGTFAWCSSPLVLQRLQRDNAIKTFDISDNEIWLAADSVLTQTCSQNTTAKKVFLEDLDFEVQTKEAAASITTWADNIAKAVWPSEDEKAWQEVFKQRFAIVSDDVFNYLTETATQVDTRIRINPDTKTTKKGALWTEEYLPMETILAGMVSSFCQDLIDQFCLENKRPILQLGGMASVGRGQVRCLFCQSITTSGGHSCKPVSSVLHNVQ